MAILHRAKRKVLLAVQKNKLLTIVASCACLFLTPTRKTLATHTHTDLPCSMVINCEVGSLSKIDDARRVQEIARR